jgi:hypothetical protein
MPTRQHSLSLILSRRDGDPVSVAIARAYEGHVAFFRADFEAARAPLREAREILHAHHNTWGLAFASYGAGLVELMIGNLAPAQRLLTAALELDRGIGSKIVRKVASYGSAASAL